MDATALTISIVVITGINYYYLYYNDGTWGCINSTLACNGELDCRFDRSDEQGCGMFPREINDYTICL